MSNTALKLFILTILIKVGIRPALCQNYNFQNYSIEQNLAQSQVLCIHQDQKRFIWIGTIGGLSKFDGKNFQNFTVLDGLPNNQINDITESKNGTLWLAVQGGICYLKDDKITLIPLPKQNNDAYILSLEFENDSLLWLGSDRYGLFKFNTKNLTFQLPSSQKNTNLIRDLFKDKSNEIWAVSRNKVFSATTSKTLLSNTGDTIYYAINQQKDGTFWIASSAGAIKLKNNKQNIITPEDGLVYRVVRNIFIDKNDKVWAATKYGVSEISNKEIINLNEKNGLKNANAKVVFEDNEGNIWIGTDGNGVFKYSGKQIVNYYATSGIKSNQVMTMLEDGQQNFWFGTYGNGLAKKNKENSYSYYGNDELLNRTIWSSFKDSENKLWFGTSQGVSCFKNNVFTHFDQSKGLNANRVTAIAEDSEKSIWLGVKNGVIKHQNGVFTSFFEDVIGKRVKSIITDKNELWLASTNGIVNVKSNVFKAYSINSSIGKLNAECLVNHLGYLWAGTSNGLYVFNKSSKKGTLLKIGETYNSNVVNSITTDNYGFLWLGTNNGVIRFNPFKWLEEKKIRTTQILVSDGLPSLECNQNSIFRDNKGYVWLGTSNGTCRINPTYYKNSSNNKAPELYLTDIRLFLKQSNLKEFADIDEMLPNNFTLPHNKNYLTFDFVGLHFKNPEKIKYHYRLLGFQNDWSPTQKERFVTFSYLPPGKYTFEVQASFNQKNWSETKSVSFTISKPFWFRWWFILSCLIIIGSIIIVIYKTRENIRSKKLEAERASYQSQLLELEQQALNASMNRHFVFNSLNSIQYFINTQDRKSASNYLTKFAKLIRKNLDDIQNEHVTLHEELERIKLYLTLEEMRFEGDFDSIIDIEKSINPQICNVPSMLFQPFVENSILHGILPLKSKGRIIIKIQKTVNEYLSVIIEDNGIGIEKSRQKKVNLISTHISKGMNITEERLKLLKKKYLKSEISVKGPYEIIEEGKTLGTRVEIILPLIYI